MTITVEVEHRSSIGAVRDQGARPTCLCHATSAAHEKARGIVEQLSPEYLHYFASKKIPGNPCTFPDATTALALEGQPLETACPYSTSARPGGWAPPTCSTLFRRASETRRSDVAGVEGAIRSGSVPVLGLTLPMQFFAPTSPWVISGTGPIRARHAVAAVGLGTDHSRGTLFLIRNSWGATWADAGHAWLTKDFLDKHLTEYLVPTHEIAP